MLGGGGGESRYHFSLALALASLFKCGSARVEIGGPWGGGSTGAGFEWLLPLQCEDLQYRQVPRRPPKRNCGPLKEGH